MAMKKNLTCFFFSSFDDPCVCVCVFIFIKSVCTENQCCRWLWHTLFDDKHFVAGSQMAISSDARWWCSNDTLGLWYFHGKLLFSLSLSLSLSLFCVLGLTCCCPTSCSTSKGCARHVLPTPSRRRKRSPCTRSARLSTSIHHALYSQAQNITRPQSKAVKVAKMASEKN